MQSDDLYAFLPDDYLTFPGCHEASSHYVASSVADHAACAPFNLWDADGVGYDDAEPQPGRREEEELPA